MEPRLTPVDFKKKILELSSKRKAWLHEPHENTLHQLASLARVWEKDSPWTQRALAIDVSPLSKTATSLALEALSQALRFENLERALIAEIGENASELSRWRINTAHQSVKTLPLGIVGQIVPANNFITGIVGLLQCLLTRNSAILKLPHNDKGFVQLFIDSMKENSCQSLTEHVLLVNSKEFNSDLADVLKQEADAIVVWGNQGAVDAFPQNQCSGKVIPFGPRVGVGVILEDSQNTLSGFAWDIALWEQLACSSPRLVFVKDDSLGQLSKKVSQNLDEALHTVNKVIPASVKSLDEETEILEIREKLIWKEHAQLFTSRTTSTHSVLWCQKVPETLPVGLRTTLIIPYSNTDHLITLLTPLRPYLQSVTTNAEPHKNEDLFEELARIGVSQFLRAGQGLPAAFGFPHEGDYLLRRLTKTIAIHNQTSPFGMTP